MSLFFFFFFPFQIFSPSSFEEGMWECVVVEFSCPSAWNHQRFSQNPTELFWPLGETVSQSLIILISYAFPCYSSYDVFNRKHSVIEQKIFQAQWVFSSRYINPESLWSTFKRSLKGINCYTKTWKRQISNQVCIFIRYISGTHAVRKVNGHCTRICFTDTREYYSKK